MDRREPGEDITRSPLLLAVFFGDRVDRATLARYLREHRARHERKLAEYRARLPEIERAYRFPALTMRYGSMREEMVLAWFDMLATEGLLDEKRADAERCCDGAIDVRTSVSARRRDART